MIGYQPYNTLYSWHKKIQLILCLPSEMTIV